jgi:glycosyltransferase involved in cell wall biosynthesis
VRGKLERVSGLTILQIHNRYRNRGGEEAAVDAYEGLLASAGHRMLRLEADSTTLARGALSRIRTAAAMIHAPSAARQLEALLDRNHVDVAQVHNLYPLLSPAVLAVLAQRHIPAVMILHNYRLLAPCGTLFRDGAICEECAGGWYLPMVVHRCRSSIAESVAYAGAMNLHRALDSVVRRISRFVAPSRFLSQMMADRLLPARRVAHVPYPGPRPAALPWGEGAARHVLFLGRLVAEKGLPVLLEAARRVPEVPLVIAGDGPLRAMLQQQVAAPELSHVQMVGQVDGVRRRELFADAAFSVAPSVWYENYPFAVLEALAAGRAVVASRIGGLPELVPDPQLLVPPADPEALAATLRSLWHDPERYRRWGATAVQMLSTLTDPSAIHDRLLAVYRQAMDEARSR